MLPTAARLQARRNQERQCWDMRLGQTHVGWHGDEQPSVKLLRVWFSSDLLLLLDLRSSVRACVQSRGFGDVEGTELRLD